MHDKPSENARIIDDIANVFESDWLAGSEPAIEEFASRVDEQHRTQLVLELLAVEIELLIAKGKEVRATDYQDRFPQLGKEIEEIVASHVAASARDHDSGYAATMLPSESQAGPENDDLTRKRTRRGRIAPHYDESNHIGPYKLLQQIGAGGMGTVWMAEQQEPVRRRVALKLIKAELASKEVVARFEAERQAVAMMDHHNIAKVLDAGITDDGIPFFAMELIKGIPLTDYCDANKLNLNERLDLFVQTCRAIQHAHQKGIVHRDIKPSNVLVTLYDGQPVAKVIDFGLAKAVQETANLTDRTLFTQYGQVVGTLAYMSPEQAEMNALDIDTRTDVYSLGVILYELLTGSTPITPERLKSEAFDCLLRLIREEDAPLPSVRLSNSGDAVAGISSQRQLDPKRLNTILRGDLDWISTKALEKNRNRRYDSPAALADDVQRFCSGDAIEARPPTFSYRLQKAFAKHRASFITAGTILTVLLVGLLATSALWMHSSNLSTANLKLAEENEAKAVLARKAEANERVERAKAEKLADENQTQLVRSLVRQADQLVGKDPAGAMPYYVEALRLDSENGKDETQHRIRLASTWRALPKFSQMWRHEGAINHIALSADEKYVASSSHGKSVEVRLLESAEQVCPPLLHQYGVWASSFSKDGRMLATVSGMGLFGEFRIWDLSTGKQVGEPTKLPVNPFAVAWTPRGNVVVITYAINGDGLAVTYDPMSREQLASVECSSRDDPRNDPWALSESVANSGRFARLRTNDVDGVSIIDLDSNGKRLAEFAHPKDVVYATLSPDGKKAVTATANQLFIWDVESGQEISRSSRDVIASAQITLSHDMKAAFSFDQRKVYVSASDGQTFILDQEGRVSNLAKLSTAGLTGGKFGPSGRWLAASDYNGIVRIWDIYGKRDVTPPMRHHSAVGWIQFTKDSRRVITGCADGFVRVWDMAASAGVATRRFGNNMGPILFARLSEDESELTFGGYTWIKVRSVETGDSVYTHFGDYVVDFTRDGNSNLMVSGHDNHVAVIRERGSGKVVSEPIRHERRSVLRVRLSDDDRFVATIAAHQRFGPQSQLGVGFVHDIESGRIVAGPLSFSAEQKGVFKSMLSKLTERLDTTGVLDITFSPDCKHIAYCGGMVSKAGIIVPQICLRNLDSDEEKELPFGITRNALVLKDLEYSPNGKYLFVSGRNPIIDDTGSVFAVWDCEDSKWVVGPNQFSSQLRDWSFSGNDRYLAIGASQHVHIYDLVSGEAASKKVRHDDIVSCVSLSNDGDFLASATKTHDVHVWDLNESQLLAPPIPHSFPVNEVTMLDGKRVMVCSHHNVTIHSFQPTPSPVEDLQVASRAFTGNSIDATGLSTIPPETLVADWKAIQEHDAKIKVREQQISAWYDRLLMMLYHQRDWAASTFHREHFIQRHPEDKYIWEQQGNAYGENQQWVKAAKYFERLLEKDPNDVRLLNGVGTTLLAAGDRDGYRRLCDRFIEAHQETEDVSTADMLVKLLAIGNAKLPNPQFAYVLNQKHLDAHSGHIGLLVNQALLHLTAAEPEEAITYCDRVIDGSEAPLPRTTAIAIRALAKKQIGDATGYGADLATARKERQKIQSYWSGVWLDLAHIDMLIDKME